MQRFHHRQRTITVASSERGKLPTISASANGSSGAWCKTADCLSCRMVKVRLSSLIFVISTPISTGTNILASICSPARPSAWRMQGGYSYGTSSGNRKSLSAERQRRLVDQVPPQREIIP